MEENQRLYCCYPFGRFFAWSGMDRVHSSILLQKLTSAKLDTLWAWQSPYLFSRLLKAGVETNDAIRLRSAYRDEYPGNWVENVGKWSARVTKFFSFQ